MRQEIKFCADVYRLLFEHIDPSQPCYLCLDGAATVNGFRKGHLKDRSMPDFFWYFKGSQKQFSMEAKIVHNGKISFCGDGQPQLWSAGANYAYTPHLWLGVSETSPLTYFVWEHEDFAKSLCALIGKGRTKSGKKKTLCVDIPPSATKLDVTERLKLGHP